MNLPAAYLGLLVSSLLAFAFHAARGGTLGRLLLYLVTAWVAFFLGHGVAVLMDWRVGRLGDLSLFPGVLATVVGLAAASILAGSRPERPRPPRLD